MATDYIEIDYRRESFVWLSWDGRKRQEVLDQFAEGGWRLIASTAFQEADGSPGLTDTYGITT